MLQKPSTFKFLVRSLMGLRQPSPVEGKERGFTLIELLVVVLIAGGIISGLMYLVVELLTADRVEASRTQTQQEMQMALDYISTELRQAVYVYNEECMSDTAFGSVADEDSNYCPGLYNHIPADLTDADENPILAFWKQQQLPLSVRNACNPNTAPCITGHSYALIVYTLDTSDSPTWSGGARIRRYALTQFQANGDETAGYVNPGSFNRDFRSWPFYTEEGEDTRSNQQNGNPGGTAQVLVDFVDDRVRGDMDATQCPGGYTLTSDETVPADFANSFYGCVRDMEGTIEGGQNRDTLLFLRGNPSGRPGMGTNVGRTNFLPTLETQVLSRPVLEKQPVN
ncbi:MAG: type II secretion system protein [Elainellaceae cyanobacterium]